jgi:hypothetical protein
MKKLVVFSCYAVFTAAVLLLSGCKKLLEYIEDHPGVAGGHCAIKGFKYANPFSSSDTVTFTYNSVGNPVSAIRIHTNTGAPNSLFRYDQKNRLTDMINSYGTEISSPVESWTRYFRDATGRINRDSVYSFPTIVDGNPTTGEFGSASMSAYEYDSKDRIIKVTRSRSGITLLVWNYAYDANGNLKGNAYDDKVNFHQTNKVWMFIDRDYSVNNPATANYTYNGFGLPTHIDVTAGPMFFLGVPGSAFEYTEASIEYDCH